MAPSREGAGPADRTPGGDTGARSGEGQRILGIDPGLRRTGWGVIAQSGQHLSLIAHGTLAPAEDRELAERLAALQAGLAEVVATWSPDAAAVEEVFVNKNAASTLKLGMARGIALAVPATAGLPVAHYATNLIKKAVVGTGHAGKDQIIMMVQRLLPDLRAGGAGEAAAAVPLGEDAADALAVAICHAHHATTRQVWQAPSRPRPSSGSRRAPRTTAGTPS